MLTVDQITQNIVNQLKLLDPTVSAEIGTPERKLIEATAELIASQQVDFTVLNQQHDISSMSGGRLDAYLSVFNFGRQQAQPSYGIVTFRRNNAAAQQIVIPFGTQLIANIDDSTFPELAFITTDTAVLEIGSSTVDVPAQCAIAGTIGNIDAGLISGFGGLASIAGISSVTNKLAFTGGADLEDDAAYKVRFENTFLRNISGTYDMFLALAVAATTVTKANVVGPVSRFQEYIEVPAADDAAQKTQTGGYDDAGTAYPHKRTSAKSSIPYSKYTYPTNFYLTNGTLDPSAKFFRPSVDFAFNSPPIDASVPDTQTNDTPITQPNVTFLINDYTGVDDGESIVSNAILLLEHAYMSIHSRNNITTGILNCVDVYVNGEQDQTVISTEVVPTAAHKLQNTNAGVWTYQKLTPTKVINWVRPFDGVPSAIGSLVQPLYWQPVLDLPDSITVGDSTYYRANYWNPGDSTYYNVFDGSVYSFPAHYIMTEEVNSLFGTIRCRHGIEWFQAGNNHKQGHLETDIGDSYTGALIEDQVGTQFNVEDYTFDQNIMELQAVMERNKQVTTDVLVHRAHRRYFRPIITLMTSFGVTKQAVKVLIEAALDSYFESQYYGTAIQLSDILEVIHSVPGVDNVRWTNETGHKLEEVAQNGGTFISGAFWIDDDFFIQDNELAASPDNNRVTYTFRAQNTFSL